MDASKYYGSPFLKVADVKLADGEKIRATITNVEEGKFGKPDITFDDGSKLSANATNTRRLAQAYGKETDNWSGKSVDLPVGEIEYQGRLQEAIIVVPVFPSINKKRKPERQADFDDEIGF